MSEGRGVTAMPGAVVPWPNGARTIDGNGHVRAGPAGTADLSAPDER